MSPTSTRQTGKLSLETSWILGLLSFSNPFPKQMPRKMIFAALQLSCAISAPASKEIYGDFSSKTKQGRALLGVLGQDIPHLCKFPPPGSAGEEKPRSKAPRANTELCLSRWDPASCCTLCCSPGSCWVLQRSSHCIHPWLQLNNAASGATKSPSLFSRAQELTPAEE